MPSAPTSFSGLIRASAMGFEILNPERETRLALRSLGEAGNPELRFLAHEKHETHENRIGFF
jgi:hypothetical protein